MNGKLLPHLRSLKGSGERDPRDVLASVFKETFNRMLSGYLLRDVVNVVNRVDFTSSDDIHTMGHLYESMLREMRDAAGDSGEFYTPRPVIRFVVQQVDPQVGEVVLDPAAGTGGFLVESLEHMRPQVQTVQQWRELQTNIRGIEKKPLPYLLATMNLLLHGVEQPNLRRENALATPLSQIGGPQELREDQTPRLRGVRGVPAMVGRPQTSRTRRDRVGLARVYSRHRVRQLQSRSQESQSHRRSVSSAPAATHRRSLG